MQKLLITLTILLFTLGLNGCHPLLDNPGIINGDVKNYQAPTPSGNLWDNISDGFVLNHYSNRPEVQAQIKWFMSHQEYLKRVATRATPYAYYVLEQIKRRGIPTELTLLPIVESAYNPFMYSSAGAAGLWQFMPGTASGFKLRQDWWYDGRRDVYASTNAALNYLQYLSKYFNGHWLLALAAYNSGEGTVSKAVHHNAALGKPTDFWDLNLPKQTRTYVPKLLALATILDQPEKYPVDLPAIPNTPYLAVVTVGAQINLSNAAKYAGITTEDLYALNPGYKKWATDPNGSHQLILPVNKVKAFKIALTKRANDKQVTWRRYIIKRGDSLQQIATNHGTTTQLLEKLNDINSTVIQIGQALLIPIGSHTLPQEILNSVKHYLNSDNKAPGQTRIVYIVKSGDTLQRIARRNHVTISELAFWNQIDSKANISARQKLIIWSKRRRTYGQNYSSQARPYIIQHLVITGDNLLDLAKKYHVNTEDIRKANNLRSNIIQVGQVLIIPPTIRRVGHSSKINYKTTRYKVRPGDSVGKIAHHYNVTTANLRRWNGIGNNNLIKVGQTLLIYY